MRIARAQPACSARLAGRNIRPLAKYAYRGRPPPQPSPTRPHKGGGSRRRAPNSSLPPCGGGESHMAFSRHGRACPGHPRGAAKLGSPRFFRSIRTKTWMPGTSPGMTAWSYAIALPCGGGLGWGCAIAHRRCGRVDPLVLRLHGPAFDAAARLRDRRRPGGAAARRSLSAADAAVLLFILRAVVRALTVDETKR